MPSFITKGDTYEKTNRYQERGNENGRDKVIVLANRNVWHGIRNVSILIHCLCYLVWMKRIVNESVGY